MQEESVLVGIGIKGSTMSCNCNNNEKELNKHNYINTYHGELDSLMKDVFLGFVRRVRSIVFYFVFPSLRGLQISVCLLQDTQRY